MSTKFPAFWAFSPLYSMTLFTPIVPCNTGTSQICKALKLYTQLPSKCLHFDVPKAAYRSNISKVKHLLYPQIAILSVSLFKWMVVVATNLSQKAKCHPRLFSLAYCPAQHPIKFLPFSFLPISQVHSPLSSFLLLSFLLLFFLPLLLLNIFSICTFSFFVFIALVPRIGPIA